MRHRLFAFLMAGAIVMGGCTDDSDDPEYIAGHQCITSGDNAQTCYAMCAATFASQHGSYVQRCARGVAAARVTS